MFSATYNNDHDEDKERGRALNLSLTGWFKSFIPKFDFSNFNLSAAKKRRIVEELEECDETLLNFLKGE